VLDRGGETENVIPVAGDLFPVIGQASGIRVMLFDPQIGFVMQQPVEYVGGVPYGGTDELAVEGSVRVRNVRVDCRARLVAPSEELVVPSPQCAANSTQAGDDG
jgi:hypothetical protein